MPLTSTSPTRRSLCLWRCANNNGSASNNGNNDNNEPTDDNGNNDKNDNDNDDNNNDNNNNVNDNGDGDDSINKVKDFFKFDSDPLYIKSNVRTTGDIDPIYCY